MTWLWHAGCFCKTRGSSEFSAAVCKLDQMLKIPESARRFAQTAQLDHLKAMTKGKVVLLVEPLWFWNTACTHVLSPWCRCLSQATIHDCQQLPSCLWLLGVPCVGHVESAPIRRKVWWFTGLTSDSLAQQRSHPGVVQKWTGQPFWVIARTFARTRFLAVWCAISKTETGCLRNCMTDTWKILSSTLAFFLHCRGSLEKASELVTSAEGLNSISYWHDERSRDQCWRRTAAKTDVAECGAKIFSKGFWSVWSVNLCPNWYVEYLVTPKWWLGLPSLFDCNSSQMNSGILMHMQWVSHLCWGNSEVWWPLYHIGLHRFQESLGG